MSIPVALRPDYDAVRLGHLARRSKDAPQTRRLLALAVIYEGGCRTRAAEIGGSRTFFHVLLMMQCVSQSNGAYLNRSICIKAYL